MFSLLFFDDVLLLNCSGRLLCCDIVNAAQDLFINLSIDERLVYLLDYKVMMIDASERESEQRATKMPANEKLSRNRHACYLNASKATTMIPLRFR